ncbi:LPS translocon maturation chaperone LptM [Trinickia acidisoli]|uniref:LPS translocon maturation chaperone LptM n=1 Tax=Trinickia acidisoli TaxID=2767482 RepID=UPI001A8C8ACF|nr:lipoprotein [Trinickia acidisoli]
MRVVFRMSAIVAALAVATSAALTGCGQRGVLYLPKVPPLPEKPALRTEPPASSAAAGSSAAPDSSSTAAQAPVTLAPADSLGATPNANRAAPAAGAASSPAPNQ